MNEKPCASEVKTFEDIHILKESFLKRKVMLSLIPLLNASKGFHTRSGYYCGFIVQLIFIMPYDLDSCFLSLNICYSFLFF